MPSTSRPTLPGFDAEAALADRRVPADPRRRMAAAHRPTSASVVPQLRVWKPGDCIPNCVCVQAEGCPCCGYQDMFPWLPGSQTRTMVR